MKKQSTKWSKSDIEILKKYYWDLGPLALTKMIPDHPKCSIVAKARVLGLNSKEGVLWTDEEVEIIKQYYPTEGSKVYKRLKNRSRERVKSKAQQLGIKYDQTIVEWPIEEDELIYDFYMKYKEQSFYRLSELSNILEQRGFTKHGTTTIKMRLQNYSYLDNGIGLSHVAKQSRTVYENKAKKTSPHLRQNGSL